MRRPAASIWVLIALAMVGANLLWLPNAQGPALPPRPAPRDAEATSVPWAWLDATRVNRAEPDRSLFSAELRALDGQRVSLFGAVMLHADGLEGNVARFSLLGPAREADCCPDGYHTAVCSTESKSIVLVEHRDRPWIVPRDNPGVFAEVTGTLRVGQSAESLGYLFAIEGAELAFYRLGPERAWHPLALAAPEAISADADAIGQVGDDPGR